MLPQSIPKLIFVIIVIIIEPFVECKIDEDTLMQLNPKRIIQKWAKVMSVNASPERMT